MAETMLQGWIRRIGNALKKDTTEITHEIVLSDKAAEALLDLLKEYDSIVRCKDCEEYKLWGSCKICMRLGSWYGNMKPEDFCSYGRLKQVKQNDH